MTKWLQIILQSLISSTRSRRDLAFENLLLTGLSIEEFLIAPRSPWQNPNVERVIGSIRRECLDHTIILGERHLRRVAGNYVNYYNTLRTHLSLSKNAPTGRSIQLPEQGHVAKRRHVGGLHHEYFRKAA
jgi:transposase InsO family protein